MNLFRDLTEPEEKEFRATAREQYEIGTPISPVWHPVYRDECEIMNKEAAGVFLDGYPEVIRNVHHMDLFAKDISDKFGQLPRNVQVKVIVTRREFVDMIPSGSNTDAFVKTISGTKFLVTHDQSRFI